MVAGATPQPPVPQTVAAVGGPPVVTAAAVPFYPAALRSTGTEGTVTLQITTDGRSVSSVALQSGKAMALVHAAEQNVKTWRFESHEPTSFNVTFTYRLLPEPDCRLDSGQVVLHLPTQVEVTAKPKKFCDAFEPVKK